MRTAKRRCNCLHNFSKHLKYKLCLFESEFIVTVSDLLSHTFNLTHQNVPRPRKCVVCLTCGLCISQGKTIAYAREQREWIKMVIKYTSVSKTMWLFQVDKIYCCVWPPHDLWCRQSCNTALCSFFTALNSPSTNENKNDFNTQNLLQQKKRRKMQKKSVSHFTGCQIEWNKENTSHYKTNLIWWKCTLHSVSLKNTSNALSAFFRCCSSNWEPVWQQKREIEKESSLENQCVRGKHTNAQAA